jgi:hypothetical protein
MIKWFHDPPAEIRSACAGRRIVVIEVVGWLLLPIALLLRATGRRVIYLHPPGGSRRVAWIGRLAKLGLEMNEMAELPGFNLYGRLVTAEDCAEEVVVKGVNKPFLDAVERLFPDVQERQRKIRLLLFDALYTAYWDVADSMAVASYYAQAGAQVVIWNGLAFDRVLLHVMRPLPAKALFPPALQLIMLTFRVIWWLAARVMTRWRPKSQVASGSNATAAAPATREARVLYLPHKGISYGGLFDKSQYYVDEPGHALERHNILHVELPEFMSAEEYANVVEGYRSRGYRHAGLYLKFGKLSLRTLAGVMQSLPSHSLSSILLFIGAVVLARRVDAWRNGLVQFPAARLALVHFEFIAPRPLRYALQSCGIRVVSLQERHIAVSRKSHSQILDGYLVQSERCREWSNQNPFSVIAKIDVVGDYHAAHLKRLRAARQPASQFLVACYDFHSVADPVENAQLAFNNWKNNSRFYEAVEAAAQRFPVAKFVIHAKDGGWMELPFFQPLAKRITQLPNVEIVRKRVLDSGYRLAAAADCILARYTSLVDQAMAAGIPSLIYEEVWRDHRCVSWWRDYNGYPVFVRSHPELLDRMTDIMERNNYMAPAQFQALRQGYYDLDPGSANARIRAALERWLEVAGIARRTKPTCESAVAAPA